MARSAFEHFSDCAHTVQGRPHAWLKRFEAAHVLHSSAPFLLGAEVLDLGSGDGYYARHFVNAGAARVDGLDFCPQFAREESRWSVRQTNFEADDLVDFAAYDVIFALGVLEFLREPKPFLQRVAGSMRAGAHLILLYPPQGVASSLYRRYHRTHGIRALSFVPHEMRHWLSGAQRISSRRIHPYAQVEHYAR